MPLETKTAEIPGCEAVGHFVSNQGYCLECAAPFTPTQTVTLVRNPKTSCETPSHFVSDQGYCMECMGPFTPEWIEVES